MDENGYIPIINYEISEADRERRDQLVGLAAELLKKAGAKTVSRADWPPDVCAHIMSTMRIGFVTDSNCEALQVKRLFIADNSVLCNGLGGSQSNTHHPGTRHQNSTKKLRRNIFLPIQRLKRKAQKCVLDQDAFLCFIHAY